MNDENADQSPEDVLNYDDIRAIIEDGDVVLFRGDIPTSRIIETVSGGVYSHSGIALWWGDRLMLCQAVSKGVEAIPMRVALSGYEGAADLYKLRPSARSRADLAKLLAEAKRDLGKPYSHLDLLREGVHVLTGAPLDPEAARPEGLICSQYVSRCFRQGGLPLSDRTDLDTSPTEIATSPALELMGTIRIQGPAPKGQE